MRGKITRTISTVTVKVGNYDIKEKKIVELGVTSARGPISDTALQKLVVKQWGKTAIMLEEPRIIDEVYAMDIDKFMEIAEKVEPEQENE